MTGEADVGVARRKLIAIHTRIFRLFLRTRILLHRCGRGRYRDERHSTPRRYVFQFIDTVAERIEVLGRESRL